MAQLVRCSAKQKVADRFPVRANAWVVSLAPSRGACERQLSLSHICFSPSFSLPSPFSKKNKNFLKNMVIQ